MPGYKRSDDEAEDVQLSQPLDNPKEADPAPDLRPMAALQPQPPVLPLPPFDFDGIICAQPTRRRWCQVLIFWSTKDH